MWEKLPFADYYLTFSNEAEVEICLSNFVSIWVCSFSLKSFIKALKESNPHLEIESNDLLAKGIGMLSNLSTLKKVIVDLDLSQNLHLHIMKLYGYPVNLKLSLKLESKEMFFRKVTYLLLKSSHDFLSTQKDLCELLVRKDKEIKEYKAEGVKIIARKTPVFNKKEFMNNNKATVEVDNEYLDKIYNTVVINKRKDGNSDRHNLPSMSSIKKTPTPNEIKEEPMNTLATIKTEPTSQSNIPTTQRKVRKKIMQL